VAILHLKCLTVKSALLGPPFGGGLYSRFGLRGPVICGIICTTVDLCGRLLLIECKDARRWGFDPAADCPPGDPEKGAGVGPSGAYGNPGNQDSSLPIASDATEIKIPSEDVLEPPTPAPQHLSLFGVIKKLVGSSRALVAVFCSITNAYGLTSFQKRVLLT
jgi:DHA1 family solute carrier family 18 vesicular amine transporter 1/2